MIGLTKQKVACHQCKALVSDWTVKCPNCGMAFPVGNIHIMMARGFGIILAGALAVAIIWALVLRI
jgi:hypothetical protein